MLERAFLVAVLAALVVVAGDARSVTVLEDGDAGETLGTAQLLPGGSTPLTEIQGTIATNTADVDLYRIFISDPGAFSAMTTNGDSSCDVNQNPECGTEEFDATLALFDSTGLGVYFNDDKQENVGDAELPAGNQFSPTVMGFYFLAIADDDVTALSELSVDGPIFPELSSPFTDVVGPSGPGGGNPLQEWFKDNVVPDPRGYSIVLTGVTVPEPATGLLISLGLVALAAARARR